MDHTNAFSWIFVIIDCILDSSFIRSLDFDDLVLWFGYFFLEKRMLKSFLLYFVPIIFYLTTSFESTTTSRVEFKSVVVSNQQQTDPLTPAEKKLSSKKILVAIVVKNNIHSFPTFLASLESLKCPNKKGKCDLWYNFSSINLKNLQLFI